MYIYGKFFLSLHIYTTRMTPCCLASFFFFLFSFFFFVHVKSSIKYAIYLFFERNILSDFEKIE